MQNTIIIGAGAIAACHAEALKKLDVQVYGVCDVNPQSATNLADRYGAKVVEDLQAEVKNADMVHICTPPSFRIEYAKTAMEAGCHVVMEKPMAITIEDGQILVDLAKRNGVQLFIDFNHRFRNGFQQLLDVVRSGAIGEVTSAYVYRMGMLGGNAGTKNDTWRRKPGSVCGMSIESLSHDIDMLYQLAGPVATVKSDIRGTLADTPQFDTNANVSFNMKNGAMGLIHASWSSYLKSSSRGVIGTKGTVVLEGDDLFDFTRLRLRTEEMPYEEIKVINDIYNFVTCPSYYNANKHFLACMQSGEESPVSVAYALSTLKVSHAILESAKNQCLVTL